MKTSGNKDLLSEIRKITLNLRTVLDSSLADVSVTGRSAPDIARELKIDRKLAWKLSRFLSENNVFAAASLLPGKVAYGNLLKSFRKRGLPENLSGKMSQLFAEFNETSLMFAGDRATLDLILVSLSDEGMQQAYRSQQRSQFSANSFLLGIHSRTQFSSWFYHPSDDGSAVDLASLRGIIELRRNRPRAPFVIHSIYHGDTSGKVIENVSSLAVDENDNGPLSQCKYLHEFCSQPLPEILDLRKRKDGWTVQLADGYLGKSNQVTLVSGEIFLDAESRWAHSDEKYWENQTRIKTPTENAVIDIFLHETLMADEDPELTVCQDFTDSRIVVPLHLRSRETRIPCGSTLSYIGAGLSTVFTPSIPDYGKMVNKVLAKRGWKETEMHLFRISIEFPVTPSSVYLMVPIPEAPSSTLYGSTRD